MPLYLAECLSASTRGKGTGIFQWLLTLGIVAAALIAIFFSMWLDSVKALGDAEKLLRRQGSRLAKHLLGVAAAGRALRAGQPDRAGVAAMALPPRPTGCCPGGAAPHPQPAGGRERNAGNGRDRRGRKAKTTTSGQQIRESLLHRKYVIPFILACIILACNQLTGVNSIIGYNTNILIQAGLSDVQAHWGYVIFTTVNFLVTMIGVMLVDRKGRKFLLSIGSAGIIVSLVCVGLVFQQTEKARVDCKDAVQALVTGDDHLTLAFDQAKADKLLATAGDSGKAISGQAGNADRHLLLRRFRGGHERRAVRRQDGEAIEIKRDESLPTSSVDAFFKNPFAQPGGGQSGPAEDRKRPDHARAQRRSGWLTAVFIFCFMAFFAVGPGVCVWLALSELMPTRIRSNGMSIALLLNQAVSTTIAAIFLPTVGKYGYGTMFFAFAASTVIYFVTATFFLPETKGKTLEEIEEHFSGHKKGQR